jgi:hypothetical protein
MIRKRSIRGKRFHDSPALHALATEWQVYVTAKTTSLCVCIGKRDTPPPPRCKTLHIVQAATDRYEYLPQLTACKSCDASLNYSADFISRSFNKIRRRFNLKRDYITTQVYQI